MNFLDVFLVSLVVTGIPKPIVTARQRIVGNIGDWGFAVIKGIGVVAFFTLFYLLGKKLVVEKKIFLAHSCIFFFVHLHFFRVIHEITVDVRFAQGVLVTSVFVTLSLRFRVLICDTRNTHAH